MKKSTAVDFIVEGLLNNVDSDYAKYIIAQAHVMFEQQIMDAHYEGSENYRRQYYKETFKSEVK
jgi:hypothetical protein